jgi:hypothetical protein
MSDIIYIRVKLVAAYRIWYVMILKKVAEVHHPQADGLVIF